MSTFNIFLILIFFTSNSFCQINEDVDILVEYKVNVDKSKFPADLSLDVQSRFRNIFQVVATLNFRLLANKEESLFRVIPNLSSDFKGDNNTAISAVGGKNVYYSNDSINLLHKDLFGEVVNIELDQIYKWKVLREKKEILGYQCFKAISNYKSIDKNGKEVEVDVIAWFTPDINISAGPLGFNNLPGLVLEGSKNQLYIFSATRINFDSKEEINMPKAKRIMSEKEYDLVVEGKLKQIRNGGF